MDIIDRLNRPWRFEKSTRGNYRVLDNEGNIVAITAEQHLAQAIVVAVTIGFHREY